MGSGGETCPRSLSERIAVLRGSGLTMRARRNAEMKGRYEPSSRTFAFFCGLKIF
jgi:hypothetical protein